MGPRRGSKLRSAHYAQLNAFLRTPQRPAAAQLTLVSSSPAQPIMPPAAQLAFSMFPINAPPFPGRAWSADFSQDFGPIAPVQLGTIATPPSVNIVNTSAPGPNRVIGSKIIPTAAQIALAASAPLMSGRSPASQMTLTAAPPIRVVGQRGVPAAGASIITSTAPRVLPGRLIKPARVDRLLTESVPTISAGGADYSGLPLWTAHTFANGEQCRTLTPWSSDFSTDFGPPPSAYQCSQAGISTISPTGTGTNIRMGTDGARFNYLGPV